MFRNATLGKRIGFGFGVLSVLTIAVGITGYLGLTRVLGVTEFYRNTNAVKGMVASVKEETDQYLLYNYGEAREKQEAAKVRAFAQIEKGQGFIREMVESSALDEVAKESIIDAERELSRYREALSSYVTAEQNKMDAARRAGGLTGELAGHITKGELWVDDLQVAQEVLAADMSTYFNRPLETVWQRVTADLEKLGKVSEEWYFKVENSDDLRAIGDAIKKTGKDLETALVQYHKEVVNQEGYQALMDKHKGTIEKICAQLEDASAEKLRRQARSSLVWMAVVIGIALLIAALYSVITIQNIVHRTRKVVEGVKEGTDQITAASGQVASSSQALAEAAGEQASSLEETSSSLEELASMTKQNADNAQQADGLTNEAKRMANDVSEKLARMTRAVEDIGKNSEETSKIIKTIDEIAFQTNLLALNAAVEAARAGEYGAGFAVVADEVRSLAIRSAEAAKNTSDLIGNTVGSVEEGARLNAEVNESFKKNAEIVGKTSDLVGEIAAASQEQAQGIEQINRAIAEMDKVTQQNAANAEESASASEEMSAQAEAMRNTVEDLIILVGGSRNGESSGRVAGRKKSARGRVIPPGLRKALPSPVRKGKERKTPAPGGKEIRPEEVIPMEEADFKDF